MGCAKVSNLTAFYKDSFFLLGLGQKVTLRSFQLLLVVTFLDGFFQFRAKIGPLSNI